MKSAILMVMVATVASQLYGSYNPYGQAGGGSVGVGTGGIITFPNDRPVVVRPVRPVGSGRPVRPFPVVGQPVVPNVPSVGQPVGTNVVRPAFPSPVQPQPVLGSIGGCPQIPTLVHGTYQGSEYHFSWCSGLQKGDWQTANSYCSRLGRGWLGVSIESRDENQFVIGVISNAATAAAQRNDEFPYIWTSGQTSPALANLRHDQRFVWGTNQPLGFVNWSPTGFNPGVRQPDNRENNAENCLAVMNNFYGDGIVWHDIACHHEKPIICERSSLGSVGISGPITGPISGPITGPISGPVSAPVNQYGKK